jgi:AraC-like DNA-binding protein
MPGVASQIMDEQELPISVKMAGASLSPCVRRFVTTDPDHARDIVRTCHSWIRTYEPRTSRDSFQHKRMQIGLGPIMLTRSMFSHVRITAENDDGVILVLAERGWRSVQGRGEPVVSAHGSLAVLVPRGRTQYENGPYSSGFVVSVPARELARSFDVGRRQSAAEPVTIDLSSSEGLQFRSTLNFIHLQLTALDASLPPNLSAAYQDVLLTGLATLILDGTQRPADRDPGARLVRRACEMIREGASGPLRLVDIAASLGVSLRHLQAGFRRHLNTTPQSFLKDCRLEHAFQRLSFATQHDTAASIAQACGFTHLSGFAGHYRRQFGECPSDTLKRWRQVNPTVGISQSGG